NLVLFSLGGMILALHPRSDLVEDAGIIDNQADFSGVTISYNAHDKNEVDAVLMKVKQLGAEIVKPATNVYWGGYSGYFRDPNGHLIEVAYNPFWPFDEHGNIQLPE
ncbi:MAG: VOC family protein, partial [Candidatus Omnitrophica bacterium]|nr:VOC family protein [Candidatus Omnitrophota bacterium]